MLTQQQADRLLAMLKEAVRRDAFTWWAGEGQEEAVHSVEDGKLQFILFLTRNPFEIRLHFRTRDRHIGLARIDNAHQHHNPDGTEIIGQPHLHLFREGYGNQLPWAEPIDWYDTTNPTQTLNRFLDIIHTRFPGGIQPELI